MDLQHTYQLLMPRLHASEALEKKADADALVTKAATDAVTLGLLKHASSAIMKGLQYGAGAAIPAGLVGAGLISHAGRESRKSIEDVRNKALQAAAGIAAIGGGMYALHHNLGSKEKPKTQGMGPDTPYAQMMTRYASAKEAPGALLEKLATVGFLDILFEHQRVHGEDPNTRQKAAECLLLNAEHGVDILRQLLD